MRLQAVRPAHRWSVLWGRVVCRCKTIRAHARATTQLCSRPHTHSSPAQRETHCQYVEALPSRSASTPLPGLAVVTAHDASEPTSRTPGGRQPGGEGAGGGGSDDTTPPLLPEGDAMRSCDAAARGCGCGCSCCATQPYALWAAVSCAVCDHSGNSSAGHSRSMPFIGNLCICTASQRVPARCACSIFQASHAERDRAPAALPGTGWKA